MSIKSPSWIWGGGVRIAPNAGGSAFTLIEVLVAIMISGIILASVTGVFMTALRLRNSATENLAETIPIEYALSTIQDDLAALIATTNTNGVIIGNFQTINQTNVQPGQVGPDFFTTRGELDGVAPWGDIVKIDYLLSPSTNRGSGMDLVRALTRNLLPVVSPPAPDTKQVLLHGVQNFFFSYYDGLNWDQQWDTTQQTNIPNAIKMTIQMASQGVGRTMRMGATYELVVPVDIQVTTNQTTALP